MNWMTILTQTAAAALGTVAFSLLFGVPKKLYGICAAIGGVGWLAYLLLKQTGMVSETEITFACTLLVVFLSRLFAVVERCPATVFVTTGIFPLIPGAGIYWTAWYLISGKNRMALDSGLSALKAVFAIVLGIVVVFELPQKLFLLLARRGRRS